MAEKKPTKDQIKADDIAKEITGAEELDDADLDEAAGGAFLAVGARNLNKTFNTADSFNTADGFNTADSFNTADGFRAPSSLDTAGTLGGSDKLKR